MTPFQAPLKSAKDARIPARIIVYEADHYLVSLTRQLRFQLTVNNAEATPRPVRQIRAPGVESSKYVPA